jgi:hypothetical protein
MTANVFGITPEEGTEAHELEGTPSEKPAAPDATPAEQATKTEETEAPAPAPEPTPQPAPAPEREEPASEPGEEEEGLSEDGNGFRIGNKVYKDIMAADQAFRQQRGRAQAEARRAKELSDERDRLLQENAALKARGELPQPQTPVPDPSAPAETPNATQGDGAGLTELLTESEINELIAEEGADKALVEVQKRMDARAREQLDARTAPLRQHEEAVEAQQVAMEAFSYVSQTRNEAGDALFPELDENSPHAPEIVSTWDQLIMEDPDFRAIALSPAGVKYAYQVWKATSGTSPQPASAPEPPQPSGTEAQNSALAGMSAGQRGAPTSPASQSPPPRIASEEAVRKLLAARENPVFGVEVEAGDR